MQGFSMNLGIFVWRLITNIYCQTCFQEKDTATIVVFMPLPSAAYVCVCARACYLSACVRERECCLHDHDGHISVCVFLRDLGLCLLPTTLCMFVSTQAEKLWCFTCVSNSTQPHRPGKGLRVGGESAFSGRGE